MRVGLGLAKAPPGYPAEFERDVRLHDGRHILVRPIVPEDAPDLAEAIASADADTLRSRFLGGSPRLTPAMLTKLCTVDFVARFTLIAREPGTRHLIAVAGYEPLTDGVAEVAVAVCRAWRRVGLATALVEMLGLAALDRGVSVFNASYFAGNRGVRRLFDLAGGTSRGQISNGIAECAVALDRDAIRAALHAGSAPTRPDRSTRPTIPATLQLADVIVEVADTLGDTFDLTDYLHLVADRCVRLLGVSAVGILLRDENGEPQTAAATQERARLLDEFAVQVGQGPGVDCFRTGRPVSAPNVSTVRDWPRFVAATTMTGFASVHVLPLRLRDQVIGTLSLFGDDPGALDEDTRRTGQALADVATIGLLQHRAIHDREVLARQLQTALDSRVAIEQAKGILAERLQVSVADAFTLLRGGARNHNRRLADLARAVVDGTDQVRPASGTSARSSAGARQ